MASRKPARGQTHGKGLGWRHQQQRAMLLRQHTEGSRCELCTEPMFAAQGLQADHSVPRAIAPHGLADRLVHQHCNSRAGALLGHELNGHAINGQPVEREVVDLGRRLMAWPC